MWSDYIPLISGFVGAIIGAFASVATIWIQSRHENKRQLTRLAYEAAIEDHKAIVELYRITKRGMYIHPLPSYINFHVKYMSLVERGNLNEETLATLVNENESLWKTPESEPESTSN